MNHLHTIFLSLVFAWSAQCQPDSTLRLNKNAITVHFLDMAQLVGFGYHRLIYQKKESLNIELAAGFSIAPASMALDTKNYFNYTLIPTALIGSKQVRFSAGLGAFLQQDFPEDFGQNALRPTKYRVFPHGKFGLRFDRPQHMVFFNIGVSSVFDRAETRVLKEPNEVWSKTTYGLIFLPGGSIGLKF
jgi:hypothetical protein